jgi:hypothetical protein
MGPPMTSPYVTSEPTVLKTPVPSVPLLLRSLICCRRRAFPSRFLATAISSGPDIPAFSGSVTIHTNCVNQQSQNLARSKHLGLLDKFYSDTKSSIHKSLPIIIITIIIITIIMFDVYNCNTIFF